MPDLLKDGGHGTHIPGQDAGFLGKAYDPFRIEGDPRTGVFRMPAVALPPDVSAGRLRDRRLLAECLDGTLARAGRPDALADVDAFRARAFDLLGAPAVCQAFNLAREPERLRAAYGPHLFGQSCLLARRLLEARAALVTFYWPIEGPDDSPQWDTHQNNFAHLRRRLGPPADQGLAALLEDLSARGLLAETLVVCLSEFGWSPRVNAPARRPGDSRTNNAWHVPAFEHAPEHGHAAPGATGHPPPPVERPYFTAPGKRTSFSNLHTSCSALPRSRL